MAAAANKRLDDVGCQRQLLMTDFNPPVEFVNGYCIRHHIILADAVRF